MALVMLFGSLVAMTLAIDAYWAGVSQLFVLAWIVLFNITLVFALSSSNSARVRSERHIRPAARAELPWTSAALPPPFRPPQR